MKSRFFLLFFALVLSNALLAQSSRNGDGSTGREEPVYADGFNSISEATTIARDIVRISGKRSNFEVREAKIPNAAAVISNGKRYILYNPDFISKLTMATGTEWSAISVLAHEIGHHLNGNPKNGTLKLATELEADEFSGFVLKKMGATLQEAQSAMQVLANARGSSTHPPRAYRLNSIAKGWSMAGGMPNSENQDIAKNTSRERSNSPASRSVPARTTLDNRYILADIQFHADPASKYYLTTQYNVVKISNNKLYVVGKLSKLQSQQYPYLISDEQDNRVYIKASGSIVNESGGSVGRIQVHRS